MEYLDQSIAGWFHQRLTLGFGHLLHALSDPGSGAWIATILALLVLLFAFKARWGELLALVATVPGGMLLGEGLKLLVRRPRPYTVGPLVDWTGYSFPSGHAIGATLLYGMLALLLIQFFQQRRWRVAVICAASVIVALVAFSRVALGAHYLSDVVAAILLGVLWLTVCNAACRPLRRCANTARQVTERPDTNFAWQDQPNRQC